MRDLVKLVKRGEPMIWLTGSALGISILMIVGLVIVILMNGLSFFWPKPLEQVTLEDGSVFLGELSSREPIPNPGHADHNQKHRLLLRVGNRDLYGFDFKWVNEDEIGKRERPGDAFFVERRFEPFPHTVGVGVLVHMIELEIIDRAAPFLKEDSGARNGLVVLIQYADANLAARLHHKVDRGHPRRDADLLKLQGPALRGRHNPRHSWFAASEKIGAIIIGGRFAKLIQELGADDGALDRAP